MKKIFFTVLLVISLPHVTLASPAFSRQTGASCRVCHFQTMHSLSKYGRDFLRNGFRESYEMKERRRKIEEKFHRKKPHGG